MPKTAAKTAKTKKTRDEEILEYADKRRKAVADADAEFQDTVAKAADKRKKALDKFPDTGNFAERAWNSTKADSDPVYDEVTPDFRRKLDTAVDAIRTTGSANIAGLEDFEVEVKKLLAAEPVATRALALAPVPVPPVPTPAVPLPSVEPSATAPKSATKSASKKGK